MLDDPPHTEVLRIVFPLTWGLQSKIHHTVIYIIGLLSSSHLLNSHINVQAVSVHSFRPTSTAKRPCKRKQPSFEMMRGAKPANHTNVIKKLLKQFYIWHFIIVIGCYGTAMKLTVPHSAEIFLASYVIISFSRMALILRVCYCLSSEYLTLQMFHYQ